MSPWTRKTVGMLTPSCSLPATFVQNMEEPRRIQLTDTALGGLSVEETDDRKDATQKPEVRVERGAETRRRRKADRA